ncbi:MAG TPA: hypothetical protein VNA89_08370 [Gemmatimonadaceae bacterium]|nr:hypothetical protein [Gemmatimonadaceae bacterium]
MWSDTLLLAERAHLARLFLWGASSVVAGTAVLAFLRLRRARSALLTQFAIQTAAWGLLNLVLALAARRALRERDVAGATRLDRFLWLNVGLDAGYIGVGLTLALAGWFLGRRLGVVGAGVGVVVQGLALLVLDLYVIGAIERLAFNG